MSSHAGSLLRIFGTIVILVNIWFISVGLVYAILSLILGFGLSFFNFMICFLGVIAFRMFYPKNVFI